MSDARDDELGELEEPKPEALLPPSAELPEAPRLTPNLPPHPKIAAPGSVEPGSYGNTALAFTAANSFIMPVVLLSIGGWYLDQKLHHETDWLAAVGVVVGLIVGVSSLINVMKRMS